MRTGRLLFIVLMWPVTLWSAALDFYVQTTGDNMNGGSSNADAAAYTSTNGNWSTVTNVFTPTSGNPSSSGVSAGAYAGVYIDGATTPVYVAKVSSVNSTTITLSSSEIAGTAPVTSATARTIKVGGAWKGPNGATGFPFNFAAGSLYASGSARVNFKNGTTYAITTAMTHTLSSVTFQGYTTSVGDGGRAIIDGGTSGASYVLLAFSTGNNNVVRDMIWQNNGATGSADGVTTTCPVQFDRCVFHDFRGSGLTNTTTPNLVTECEAYLCNVSNTALSGGFNGTSTGNVYDSCISHDNAGASNNGFVNTNRSNYQNCIADTNGNAGFITSGAARQASLFNCSGYNNGTGFLTSANPNLIATLRNCLWISNSTYGVNVASTTGSLTIRTNGYFGNTTAAKTINASPNTDDAGEVTLSGNPFVDAPNGNFKISLAAAKGVGRGIFTQTQASYTGTLGYPDLGAAQHLETVNTERSATWGH